MAEPPDAVDQQPARGRCPICRRPSDTVLRPFCSKRCADVDLHRWLSGGYRIEADEEPDDAEENGRGPDRPPE